MKAGRRNKKVTVERMTAGRGDYGEEIETWATLSTAWVHIKPLSGDEKIQGGQVDAKATHLITFRKTDITPADRITRSSRVFNIVNVFNPEERGYDQQVLVFEDV